MNSFNKRTLQGTLLFSGLFLGLCLLVVLLLPAKAQDDTGKVSEFNSFSNLGTLVTEDFFSDSSFKTDYSDDYSPEDDQALALYRQPQSRPAVEWFFSRVTGDREIAQAILENADKNDISPTLAFSLAYVESRFNANAVNKNSNYTIDRGLFQLNSASFPKLTEAEFFDPKISAKYGISHLRYCMDVAGNDITALAMYNAGTSRVKANKTPQHTLNYVAKISNYKSRLDSHFDSDVLAFYQAGSEKSKALALVK